MNLTWITSIGLLLTLSGFTFLISDMNEKELLWIEKFQIKLSRSHKVIVVFREIWVLGTTAVLISSLMMMAMRNLSAGLIVAFSYLLFASIEKLLKITFHRQRPFQCSSTIQSYQPKTPNDPSFPSGDTLRIWLLAITFPLLFALPDFAYIVTSLIALLVSAGRIILGVHFPTDTLTGSGLGILSASVALVLINHFHLII